MPWRTPPRVRVRKRGALVSSRMRGGRLCIASPAATDEMASGVWRVAVRLGSDVVTNGSTT